MTNSQVATFYEFVQELATHGRNIDLLNKWVIANPELRRELIDVFHDEVRAKDMDIQNVSVAEPSPSLEGVKSTGVSTLMAMLASRDSSKVNMA